MRVYVWIDKKRRTVDATSPAEALRSCDVVVRYETWKTVDDIPKQVAIGAYEGRVATATEK